MTSVDREIEEAKKQKLLMDMPPPSIELREEYIKWVDKCRDIVMHLIYATTPESAWINEDAAIEVILHGNVGQAEDLPVGLYFILPPLGVPKKFHDALSLAFSKLCILPPHLPTPINMLKVVLPKPSAHEVFAASMFISKYAVDHKEDPITQSWANKLLEK